MERAFLSSHYPDVFMREALAVRLELKESRVAVSFCVRLIFFSFMSMMQYRKCNTFQFGNKGLTKKKTTERKQYRKLGQYYANLFAECNGMYSTKEDKTEVVELR